MVNDMGRLIDADALIEELNRYEKELRNDREVAIETDDEQMLFAIMNQETAIYRIRRNAFNIPTAYDVEKVIENAHNHFLKTIDDSGEDSDYFIRELLKYNKGICNIIRKGGVE